LPETGVISSLGVEHAFMADPRDEIISELRATVERLTALVEFQAVEIADLKAEVARLKGGGRRSVPDWVKANVPKTEPKPRTPRKDGFARRKSQPDAVVVHSLDQCPDCGCALSGGWVHDDREVIDLPEVKVHVTHHRLMRYRCCGCGKQCTASADLSDTVAGRHRVSIRLMSFIGYLNTVCRLPKRAIQALLSSLYDLKLSIGGITRILHDIAARGEGAYRQLQEAVRSSPFVHADETGWREDGRGGYLWSFSTPDVRFFVLDSSRSSRVPQAALGDFEGVLVSDFYRGYLYYKGLKQKCWVHFLRELHQLTVGWPQRHTLQRWAKRVNKLYNRAKKFASPDPELRAQARLRFEAEAVKMAQPAVGTRLHHAALAKRIVDYAKELFTFVEHPEVPSDNNAAERSIRPAVVQRKISGGTRSPKGSYTMGVNLSLYGTWAVRGTDPLKACAQLLAGSN
jgi:hypothetical protein